MGESNVLTGVEQCGAAWLTGALRRAGALQSGTVVAVRRQVQATTTSTVAHLRLRYSRGARGERPARLFLKVPAADPKVRLPEGFRRGDVLFYQRIAGLRRPLPVPRCYSAAVDDAGRFHLLLEDLRVTHAPVRPGPRTPVGRCRRMVECLADFHASWWGRGDLLRRFGPLPTRREPLRYGRSLQETLPGFLRAVGADLPAALRRLYARAAERFGLAVAAIHRPERLTLVNGDAHPANVLLARDGCGGCIVDWQFHHVGLWHEDLMHMLGLCWPPARRRVIETDLLRCYHRRLLRGGVRGLDWDLCWRGYRLGAIDNLFMPMWQWTLHMPRAHWQPTIFRAATAVEELACVELL
jgi:hypothetical protein